MFYILDDLGYIEEVSTHYIERDNKTCTEYAGAIPEEFETYDDWALNANIRAYKLDADGNLIFDADRDAALQEEFNVEDDEIVITSTNKAPNRAGDWILIDKEFTPATGSNGFTNSKASASTARWVRSGHTITLDLYWTTSVQIADDTIKAGAWDLKTLGVSSFLGNYRANAFSDNGQSIAFMVLEAGGAFSSVDQLPDAYIASGRTLMTTFALNFTPDVMLDSACNKFYWRRKKEGE